LFNTEADTVGDVSQANDWIEAYAARLAANQKNLSERTARYVFNRGQANGLTSHQIGRRIGELWALSPQHAAAVENYREGLGRQELRAGRIRTLVRGYADRLMRSRYTTLSHTEALSAFNLGREVQWMQAVQRGDMPIDTVKMWVTAQDELVCKVCRPLDGKTAALGQAFETENSRIVVPAIHPNCRCIIVPVAEGTADVNSKEFIFPKVTVSKHLMGQHDQDTHGRKGHGREEHGTSETITGAGVAAAMAGAGIMLLARRPPGFVINSLHMRPSGKYADIARKMNSGINPGQAWASRMAIDVKNNASIFRDAYVTGKFSTINQYRMTRLLANAPEAGAPLQRGMFVPQREVFDSYQAGRTMTFGPSSFTTNPSIASDYGRVLNQQQVVFHAPKSTRGLHIDRWRDMTFSFHPDEAEVLVAGAFRINRVVDQGSVRHVYIQQTGTLAPRTPAPYVAKHLGGPDGTADHPSGTPQSIHSGKTEEVESEPVWDFAARILSGGEVTSRADLTKEMRTKNRQASTPLRKMRNGKITDFSTRQLGLMTEGVGFRLGNENHIKQFANRMMAGEDLFRYGNRRDPIMLLVYDNGAQVLDGKHRLAAAHKAGKKKVPVQVARIKKDMPEPEGLRQEWDDLRRNLVRYQWMHNELPKKPSEPFETRDTRAYERRFNEWMQTRSALKDEERFLEHGVERGTKPKLFGKVGT
jgi:hypothetical protein